MHSICKLFSILLPFLFLSTISFSQVKQSKSCGTDQYLQQQILKDPGLQNRMDAIEKFVQKQIKNPTKQTNRSALITIPVVFHVLYNNSTQNISTAQLQSQIDVLNEDFAALNSDIANVPTAFQGLTANTQIQFCIASVDPNGNPTNGIIRVSTNTSSFGTNNAIKFTAQGGSDAWPASDYMNFWVGNLTGGLLGYAQFPGGTASTDGVVCLYTSIGRPPFNTFGGNFNLGRTATHEVGHWLNLRHIWGDSNCGNDFVADTPTQQTSNGGCPNFPHVTCSNGPNGDMFMNYMDYVNDACMVMFSTGQSTRMNATFAVGGPRNSLLNSVGCGSLAQCIDPPTPGQVSASLSSVCAGTLVNFSLSGSSGGVGETYQWQQSTNNSTWNNISGAVGLNTSLTISSNTYVRCNVTCGTSTVSTPSTMVSTIGGSISTFPYTEDFDGVTSPAMPCGWTTQDNNADGFEITNETVNPRSGTNCPTYKWNTNTTTAADDWLFTPPVNMTAGNNYEITFWYRARSATYAEALEVNWGTSPTSSAMTGGVIFSDNNITSTSYLQATSSLVSPSTSGNYYFGIHVNSLADKYDLHIDDITINEIAPCSVPPVGGTVSGPANIEAGPGGGTYNLSAYSGDIQWQFAVIPGGPYSDFPGSTSPSIDVISSSPGTYYLRAKLSGIGCADAYSNEFTIVVDLRTGDIITKPIVLSSANYSYT
ncbi:MAG: zinc metalloprotease, partial [Bacteroidia bacterium]|nr:zinc metalloprotease [Bacteroidia bacterium]